MQNTNYSLSNINLKIPKMKSRNKSLPFFIIAFLLAISQQTRAISLDVGDSPAYDYGLAPYIPMATPSDSKPVYKLFIWTKDGEKNGYLFADKPEFRLDGNVVKFQSAGVAIDIPKDQLDKFTLEQVLPTDPTGITLHETLLLGLRRTEKLEYVLQPTDAITQVTWLNAASDVVGIDGNGWLTGLKPGTAVVRAQTGNGLRAACEVTVPMPRYRLMVWTTNGRHTSYPFADKPEITIEGNIFTVTSARTTMGYQAADIEKFTLEDASVTAEDMSFADVNGDGAVDVADIATIISVMAQGDKIEEQVIAADVNGDGVVDVADIATIISVMAGK